MTPQTLKTFPRLMVEASKRLGMLVNDHLAVGRDGVASFKALGLF